jgi:hypothetical protein
VVGKPEVFQLDEKSPMLPGNGSVPTIIKVTRQSEDSGVSKGCFVRLYFEETRSL